MNNLSINRKGGRIAITLEALEDGKEDLLSEGDVKNMAKKPEVFKGEYFIDRVVLEGENSTLIDNKVKVSNNPEFTIPKSWFSKVNHGETIILFARKKSDPDSPVVTFDFNPQNLSLNNAEGMNRRKPNQKESAFIGYIIQELKTKRYGAGKCGV